MKSNAKSVVRNFNLKKNDMVSVMVGKERGKSGKILRLDIKKGYAIVEKLNIVKRHKKPDGQTKQGGIIEREAPIRISNLMLVCDKCGKPVRVRIKRVENGAKKIRVCIKCNDEFDKRV